MEPEIGMEVRSVTCGGIKKIDEIDALRFSDGVQTLISVPTTETGSSSFTALLELPPNQAVELLHSPGTETTTAVITETLGKEAYLLAPVCPSSTAFLDGASKFSVFAATETSPTCSIPVKEEPANSESQPDSSLVVSNPVHSKSTKRKEREKKVKAAAKRNKTTTNDSKEDANKLPYVHVRARRGQATDSHSLAERARREKINARMKLLQDLVPGCNKISGTAMVLDEIINHVQTLQRQVEFLSMQLAAINPRIDINLDSLLAAESESLMNCNLSDMAMPPMWQEVQHNVNRQLYQQLWHFDGPHQPGWVREEGNLNLLTPENLQLTYDNSANSASLHTDHQLKMEL